jgi:hypothetical protein
MSLNWTRLGDPVVGLEGNSAECGGFGGDIDGELAVEELFFAGLGEGDEGEGEEGNQVWDFQQ